VPISDELSEIELDPDLAETIGRDAAKVQWFKMDLIPVAIPRKAKTKMYEPGHANIMHESLILLQNLGYKVSSFRNPGSRRVQNACQHSLSQLASHSCRDSDAHPGGDPTIPLRSDSSHKSKSSYAQTWESTLLKGSYKEKLTPKMLSKQGCWKHWKIWSIVAY
jgi:hypothetical protein